MKIAKLYSFNDIRIEDIPIPSIAPDEALMKVKASGICSGDVMPWYIEKKSPLVPGHEPAGEIIEIGKNVTGLKPGQRVFVHHHAPCMECLYCKRGDHVQCKTWRDSKILPGGISEYILIPKTNLQNDTLTLPENVTYEDGVLIEPAACVVKSFRRSNIKKGDTVLIIGLGIMGMLHILAARHYGAGKVIGADMVNFRINQAKAFGADRVIDVGKSSLKDSVMSLTNGKGAEVVIVGPNSVKAMDSGLQCSSPGGTVVLFTPAKPDEQFIIDPNYIYFNDINISTTYSCGPDDTREALELIQSGLISAEELVTHKYSIDDAAAAYKKVAEARDSLKVLITFP